MSVSFGNRFDNIFDFAFPLSTALLCVMISMLPIGLSSGFSANPSFALMAIFYWALYRPDLMPPVSVFLVGLFQDLISGAPGGFWAFVYLIVYAIVFSQRLFFIGKAFFAIWTGFGVIALIVGMVAWAIICLNSSMYLSPAPFISQAMFSFIFYPLIGRVLGRIQKRFLSQI